MALGAITMFGPNHTACQGRCCCQPHHCHHPVIMTARCTCPPVWGSINPPPWCPTHGQAVTTRIIY